MVFLSKLWWSLCKNIKKNPPQDHKTTLGWIFKRIREKNLLKERKRSWLIGTLKSVLFNYLYFENYQDIIILILRKAKTFFSETAFPYVIKFQNSFNIWKIIFQFGPIQNPINCWPFTFPIIFSRQDRESYEL